MSSDPGSDSPSRRQAFAVEFSDPAAAEADAAYLWLSRRSPEFAAHWYAALLREAQKLDTFPSRCPVAPENESFPDAEVRQLLYHHGRLVYRLLFVLVDADGDGTADTVRILHVRHGAQQRVDESLESNESSEH